MKYIRILTIVLFLLPFLFSCEMKKDLLGGKDSDKETPSYENVGMLDLEVKAEKEAKAPNTKGDDDGEEDLLSPDNFSITIADSLGETVKYYESYVAMKEEGGLLLPVGTYSVRAAMGSDPNAGFNSPYYAGDTVCKVTEKEVAKVVAQCNLQNKKVQFVCSDEFYSQFKDDYSIVIDNGIGVLTLKKDEARIAYLKNTGTLRFTMYATTRDNTVHTYSHEFSKDDQILNHNNVLIELGAVPNVPDKDPDHGSGDDDSEEPEEPDDPDDPDDGDDSNVPDVPVNAPVIKIDVSLIEKDYIIEVPSDFEESDKPDTPGGDDDNNNGGDDNKGDDEVQKKIAITGTLNDKSFDLSKIQTVTSSSKVVINLYLPTGLSGLNVDVKIGDAIDLSLDLLDVAAVADLNESVLSGLGKELVVPSKGEKGNLKFDISPFVGLMDKNNSFNIHLKDKNGENTSAIIKLTKK